MTAPPAPLQAPQAPDVVSLQLAHLRSYEGMGRARVTCGGDCTCEATELEGLHEAR